MFGVADDRPVMADGENDRCGALLSVGELDSDTHEQVAVSESRRLFSGSLLQRREDHLRRGSLSHGLQSGAR